MAHSKDLRWWGRGRYNQRAVAIPGPKRTRPGGDSRRELRRVDREAWRLQSMGSDEQAAVARVSWRVSGS